MKLNRPKARLFLMVSICVTTLLMGLGAIALNVVRTDAALSDSPSVLFKQCVSDLIPHSVSEVKADSTHTVLGFGYGYVFRFKIDRADLTVLVDSLSLKKVGQVEYDKRDTSLTWGRHSFPDGIMNVYEPGQRRPTWFQPEALGDSVEGYASSEDGVKVLMYNEHLEEAYYITRR